MSTTFRDMANNKTNRHQWIVLDGDIDAEWIESMNTVGSDGGSSQFGALPCLFLDGMKGSPRS